jgi:alpha-glucosidase
LYNPLSKQIIFEKVEGQLASKFKNIAVVLHGFNNMYDLFKVDDKVIALKQSFTSLLIPDANINGIATEGSKILTAVIKNSNNKVMIQF